MIEYTSQQKNIQLWNALLILYINSIEIHIIYNVPNNNSKPHEEREERKGRKEGRQEELYEYGMKSYIALKQKGNNVWNVVRHYDL